jgi:hypothetical protein
LREAFQGRVFPLFAVFVFLALVSFYLPYLRGSSCFYQGDAAAFFEPFLNFMRSSIENKDSPFWNPYASTGMAQIALASPSIFYPLNLLFIALPFSVALALSMILHQCIAFFGMYFFVKELGWRKESATCAALIYALNGYMFCLVMNFTLVLAASWLPWCLFGVLKLFKKERKFLALLGPALAFLIASGRPEIFAPGLALTALLVIALFFIELKNSKKNALQFLLWSIISFGAGILLAAPVMLPALEWLQLSARNALGASYQFAWSANWYDFMSMFCMQAFGNPFSFENRMLPLIQPHPGYLPFLGSAFLGPAVLSLAFIGFLDRKWHWRWWLLSLALALAIFAAGSNTIIAPALVKIITPLKVVRYPIKLLCFLVFALAIAAARGVENWLSTESLSKSAKLIPLAFWVSVFLLSSIALLAPGSMQFISTGLQQYVHENAAEALDRLATAGLVAALLGILCQLTIILKTKIWSNSTASCLLFVQMILAFMFVANLNKDEAPGHFYGSQSFIAAQNQGKTPESFQRSQSFVADEVTQLASKNGTEKSIVPLCEVPLHMPDSYKTAPGDMMVKLALYVRQVLEHNSYMDYGIRSLLTYEGMDTVDLTLLSNDMLAHCSLYGHKTNVSDDPLSVVCRMTGTSYAITQQKNVQKLDPQLFDLMVDQEQLNVRIYAVKNCLPRFYLTKSWKVVNDRMQIIQEILHSRRSGFDPSKAALVHKTLSTQDDEILPVETPGDTNASPIIPVTGYVSNNDRIKASVKADQNCLLVLNDTFYPGWKAYVDDKPVRIFRVNALCRGIFLRAGAHKVEFAYKPDSLFYGLGACLLGLLILGISTFFANSPGKRTESRE